MFIQSGFDYIRKLIREYADKAADEMSQQSGAPNPSVLPLHAMPTGLLEYFEVLRENAFENLALLTPQEGQVGVVTHNLLYANHFMFLSEKHENLKKDEHAAVFFDFQVGLLAKSYI